MVKRTIAVAVTAAVMLAGCPGTTPTIPDGVKAQSEELIALAATNPEHVARCPALEGGQPENTTGNLLADYGMVAALAEECSARHNRLVEYIGPLVEQAKRKTRGEK